MSHLSYEASVKENTNKLANLLKSDQKISIELALEQDRNKNANDCRDKLINIVGSRFLEYLDIYKKLNIACDQIVQPQKNKILKKLLNSVIGRLLELKQEMVEIDCSDYHYLDQLLPDSKLTPYDLSLSSPKHSHCRRSQPENILNKITNKIKNNTEMSLLYDERYITASNIIIENNTMTQQQAVKLLQKSERSRQGNIRFHLMKEMHKSESFRKFKEANGGGVTLLQADKAATALQKIWRGRAATKNMTKMRLNELEFVGMVLSNSLLRSYNHTCTTADKIATKRANVRLDNEQELLDSFINLELELVENEASSMKSLISDTIREWYLNEYETTGKLPDLPEGGTQILFDPSLRIKAADIVDHANEKVGKEKGKDKGKDKKKESKDKKKDKGEDEEDNKIQLQPSNFINGISQNRFDYLNFKTLIKSEKKRENLINEHGVLWRNELQNQEAKDEEALLDQQKICPSERTKISETVPSQSDITEPFDDKTNIKFFQSFDPIEASDSSSDEEIWQRPETPKTPSENDRGHRKSCFAQVSIFKKVPKSLVPNIKSATLDGQKFEKSIVRNSIRDDMETDIREQVEKMMALELENLKHILESKGKGKGKGKKKDKKGKKEKGKKEKDLTANRTMESLEDELIEEGIMTVPPKRVFDDLIGTFKLLPEPEMDPNLVPITNIMPTSLNDLKNLLILHGTMPLSDGSIIENLKNRVKSILLVGPPGSGKRTLAYALAYESQSIFFDLSSDNIIGKYKTKTAQNLLLHMVFKVAKEHQPAVIFINNADTMFYKKVPKEMANLDPKRLKKDWPKIIKKFPINERILVIGTSNDPFPADQKGLSKIWDKILIVPRPDYGARIKIWDSTIKKLTNSEHVHSAGIHFQYGSGDLSMLARISNGFTAGQITAVIKQTMKTLEHVLPLRKLRASDFLENFSKLDPVSVDDDGDIKNWYNKTPLGKRFIQQRTPVVEEEVKGKKK